MKQPIKKIAITGGAGQIAYSLLFRLASGDLLGLNQPLSLHILELPETLPHLEGVKMELEDCAYPLLTEVHIGSDPYEIFQEADYVFLIGSKPRTLGMERKELLSQNGRIFIEQGKALNQVAKEDVIALVVGNPCNTNCLIAQHFAKRISKDRLVAMTRLDQNRAVAALAHKAKVSISDVSHCIIWGNHSSTQVPDFFHAKILGKPVLDVIKDRKWLEEDFISFIRKRGAQVIAARGKSSAGSAASAAIDAMRSLIQPSNQWFSMSVSSDRNPYGVQEGLSFSFPCISKGNGNWEIVKELSFDPFLKKQIEETEKELLEEKALIQDLLR